MTLRRVDNPPNPYLSEHREWLEPPPAARMEVYEERAASILSENDSPDVPFRWSINPYRGCQHACAYCYARPTHEYLGLGAGTDFDTRIIVKVNAAELLRKALSMPDWDRGAITFSGVTDCYQPLEAAYQLTRACLEVCREFDNPISIVTKGCLILRDRDVLRDLAAGPGAVVYGSIPFADDATAREIEPFAPPPSRRFEVMRELSRAGIPVGLLIAPIIPGLNDRDIPQILERAAACGAQSAGYVALRLPGSVAQVFPERLRAALPLKADRVESRIREMRGGNLNDPRFGNRMTGEGPYWENVQALFGLAARRHGIDTLRRPERNRRPTISAKPRKRPRGARPPHPQLLFDFEWK